MNKETLQNLVDKFNNSIPEDYQDILKVKIDEIDSEYSDIPTINITKSTGLLPKTEEDRIKLTKIIMKEEGLNNLGYFTYIVANKKQKSEALKIILKLIEENTINNGDIKGFLLYSGSHTMPMMTYNHNGKRGGLL